MRDNELNGFWGDSVPSTSAPSYRETNNTTRYISEVDQVKANDEIEAMYELFEEDLKLQKAVQKIKKETVRFQTNLFHALKGVSSTEQAAEKLRLAILKSSSCEDDCETESESGSAYSASIASHDATPLPPFAGYLKVLKSQKYAFLCSISNLLKVIYSSIFFPIGFSNFLVVGRNGGLCWICNVVY